MHKSEKVSIGYNKIGDGSKKVMLLHSWMDDAETWKPVIPYLNLLQYSFVFMDVRGYGKSKEIKGKYTSDEIASDVFNLADELGWKEFFLIGHSMSGLAAQKAALLDKENRINKVLLVTPVSAAGFPADPATKAFFKSIIQNEDITRVALDMFTENRLSDTWKKSRAERHVQVTDKEAQLAYIEMWTGENFSKDMKTVDKPFLVLSGKYDLPLFRLETQQEQFAGFKNVDFIEIENAGHFPMQETPVFLAAKMEDFFV